jgi:hypothetical protein
MPKFGVFTQSGTGADAFRRLLRSRFHARLTAGVRQQGKDDDTAKAVAAIVRRRNRELLSWWVVSQVLPADKVLPDCSDE